MASHFVMGVRRNRDDRQGTGGRGGEASGGDPRTRWRGVMKARIRELLAKGRRLRPTAAEIRARGGKVRALRLTKKQRSDQARQAVNARWTAKKAANCQ